MPKSEDTLVATTKNILALTMIAPVLMALGLSSPLLQSQPAPALPKITLLPTTSNEMTAYVQKAQANIMNTIKQVVSVPNGERTSENTMKPWHKLGSDLLGDFSMLTYLTQSNYPSKIDAAQAIQGLQVFLAQSVVQNPEVFTSLMAYVHTSMSRIEQLSPYERYEIQCLLESCDGIKAYLPEQQQDALTQLKLVNSRYEQQPFLYMKSQAPEKKASEGSFSVLTFNTCFVPGQFPFIYGGVSMPWQERIAPVAEKVLAANADIVCFQEVHDKEASLALYEALKNNYTYFYGAIGPRLLGFSLESLGLPSGLFVASKYPIENPHFTLFSVSGFPMNYGFFDFVVKSEGKSLGHVYTTHMQGLNYDQYPQIRATQMNQILAKMQADVSLEKEKIPFFLCGDLNIPYGSNEPGVALIRASFYDDYNKNQGAVCENNRTCTDYFTNHLLATTEKIDTNFQILDYALLLQSLPGQPEQKISQGYEIKTELVQMNEINAPKQALSDHHALVSTITAKKL